MVEYNHVIWYLCVIAGNMGGGFGGNMKMEGGFNNMGGGMGMRNRMNNPNYTAF